MYKVLIISLLIAFLSGCTNLYQGRVVKTLDGIRFKMSKPGSITYKDDEIKATFDTKTPSILRGIIEGYALRELNESRK